MGSAYRMNKAILDIHKHNHNIEYSLFHRGTVGWGTALPAGWPRGWGGGVILMVLECLTQLYVVVSSDSVMSGRWAWCSVVKLCFIENTIAGQSLCKFGCTFILSIHGFGYLITMDLACFGQQVLITSRASVNDAQAGLRSCLPRARCLLQSVNTGSVAQTLFYFLDTGSFPKG
jgi:hypothetical protein